MSDQDKQYYVKVAFEFGVDNEDGTLTPKNPGSVTWLSMPYENAVALQNVAMIPAFNQIMVEAGKLGLDAVGMLPNNNKSNR